MKKLHNKIVFITGASSGIGEALAEAFAANGAHVALLARRFERLQHLAKKLQSTGVKAVAFNSDVTKAETLQAAVEGTHQQLGLIDIVVANAGFGVVGKVEDLSIEDYQRQFETNVYGVLKTLYATLDDLKKTRGRLVIIGSVAGYISVPKTSAYSMSKYAIRALTEALYAELAPFGISVTLISPGFIKTEIRNVDNQGVYQAKANDPIPAWLRVSASQAANKIVKAVIARKREQVISVHGKVALCFNALFPGLLPHLFRRRSLRKTSSHPKE